MTPAAKAYIDALERTGNDFSDEANNAELERLERALTEEDGKQVRRYFEEKRK